MGDAFPNIPFELYITTVSKFEAFFIISVGLKLLKRSILMYQGINKDTILKTFHFLFLKFCSFNTIPYGGLWSIHILLTDYFYS